MNILFLGAPGSGKGTQSKNIEERFNIPQISTGDLLRAETASESKMGQELKNIMSSGKFVSDDIVLKLVSKKITSSECKNGFILDGLEDETIVDDSGTVWSIDMNESDQEKWKLDEYGDRSYMWDYK